MPENIFLDKIKTALVGCSGAFILWLFRKTLRLEIIFPDRKSIDWSDDSPRILVFWHAQQLMMPWIYLDSKAASPRKPIFALISKSKDGRFIAKAMDILNIGSVAGSSSRGGKEAMVKLVRLIKKGSHIAITPDGPKGPALQAKVGALKVSQLTGAAILPACFAAKNYWRFSSWDEMILPKPFSKAIILTGEPMIVPREAGVDKVIELTKKLELELNRITAEARQLVSK